VSTGAAIHVNSGAATRRHTTRQRLERFIAPPRRRRGRSLLTAEESGDLRKIEASSERRVNIRFTGRARAACEARYLAPRKKGHKFGAVTAYHWCPCPYCVPGCSPETHPRETPCALNRIHCPQCSPSPDANARLYEVPVAGRMNLGLSCRGSIGW